MKRCNPYIDLPLTIPRMAWMAVFATAYVLQLAYGSLLGFLWFTLGRKTEAKRLRYHEAMQRFFAYDLHRSPWWSTEIHNPQGETFRRGSIIICNHQSMLDTLCLLALAPRLLIVTRDRVWNNPFVAMVLRYADFFSVTDTQWEGRMDYCRSFIEKGYSIVIFPEGERSRDGNIQRFHKGAFFLAEQLQTDILPIFIHGGAHVLPSGVGFANKGRFYIEIGRRISPADNTFGSGYAERCKQMHQYYLKHFEEIRYKVETPDYFREMVISLYATIGLRKEAERVLRKDSPDKWNVGDFIHALVHPEQTVSLPATSPVQRLYKKYTHLPQNIVFV